MSQGAEPGRFLFPEGVDVDSDGSVYVVDKLNSRIQVFSADGQFVFEWGGSGHFQWTDGVQSLRDGGRRCVW